MARMKFLCDADRCIECNACVTACKNENEVPWGINRRRVVTLNDGKPGERSVSMACMHCTDAPCQAVCPVNAFYTTADGVVLHSKDICIGCGYCFYACPFGAPQYPRVGNFGSRGKMDKCTYCTGGPEPDDSAENTRSTAPTASPKASCRCAPRCARPSRCSPATARSSRKSTRTASRSAVMARALGDGRRRIAKRSAHNDRKRMKSGGKAMQDRAAPLRIVGVLVFLAIAAIGYPAATQANRSIRQKTRLAKDSCSQQFKTIRGLGTIPDTKSYTLEQPAGRDWRHFHEVTLRWIGGIAILGMLAVLVVFYLSRGMVRIESGRSGRAIVRFNAFERFVHWMTAVCFVILALSGLNITFGRPLLLPLMTPESFTAWSEWAKYAHNFLSFPFTLGVVLIFLMWLGGNIPTRVDIEWLKRGGGMIGHDHPPAYRFNAGQKLVYWIVVLGGGAVAVSGYVLIFPFYGTTIETMQQAEMVHSIVAMLFIAVMLGHIYIGTIGMEGAFEAMGSGTVDLNWAKEHHSLWLEEGARGRADPSQPQPTVAPGE